MKKSLLAVVMVVGLVSMVGCATVVHAPSTSCASNARWIVYPFANHTETPLAGQRVASITKALLQSRGIQDVRAYSELTSSKELLPGATKPLSVPAMLKWSHKNHYQYAVMGSVNEWRYKVGIDGEPAVGMTLEVWDVEQGRVVWSGVGAKSGASGQAVSYVGQRLVSNVLSSLSLI